VRSEGSGRSSRASSGPANPRGKVQYASDLFSSASQAPAKATAAKPVSIPAADAASEISVTSPQAATATYSEDFAGESASASAHRATATYEEDFEEGSESQSAAAAPMAAVSSAKAKASSAKQKVTIAASSTEPVMPSSPGNRRSKLAHSDEDEDYRPRRPTCHVSVQANIPVDAGVQCDPPAPDFQGMQNPWTQAFPSFPSVPSQQNVQASQASGMGGSFPGPCFGAMPAGMPAGMPFPPTGYPYWPYAPSMPPVFLQPPPAPSPSVANPLLRQLFGAALSGQRGFVPQAREAWGGLGPAFGSGLQADSSAQPAASSDAAAGFASDAKSATMPIALGHEGPSPALWALSMVDDSFKEQIELLRQAASRHRSLLEKSRAPESSGAPV